MYLMNRIYPAAILCAVAAAGFTSAYGQAITPRVRTVYSGVSFEARPSVSGDMVMSDTRFSLHRVKGFSVQNLQLGNGTSVPVYLPISSLYEVNTTVMVPARRVSMDSDVHAGWIPIAALDKAVDLARTNDRPILFLERPLATAAEKDRRLSESYAKFAGFKGFVRVEKDPSETAQSGDFASGLKKADGLLGDSPTPRFICMDARGRLLGVIPSGTAGRRLSEKTDEFSTLNGTLRTMDDNIAAGDKFAGCGRYNTALKLYKYVASCDSKQQFYSGLLENKKKEIVAAAEDRIAGAGKLLTEGDRAGASKMIHPVVTDGGDFDFMKRAQDLDRKCGNH